MSATAEYLEEGTLRNLDISNAQLFELGFASLLLLEMLHLLFEGISEKQLEDWEDVLRTLRS